MAIGDAAFSSGDIMRRLQQLETELRELRSARRLESSTIGEGGMRVAGGGVIRSTDFDGDMVSGNPGSTGWALGNDRLALLGAMVVPVEFHSAFEHGGPFAIDTTITTKASMVVPVPDWADEAAVIVVGMFSAQNKSASSDALNGWTRVDGDAGQGFNKTVAVNEVFDITTGQAEVINVSGKPSFVIDAQVWTAANSWPLDNTNNVAMSAMILFRSAS